MSVDVVDDEERPIGPKEALYDEKIAPLMTEIIQLCTENGIAMSATYLLDGETSCSTHLEGDYPNPPVRLRLMYYLARARDNIDAFLISVIRDGEKYGHSSMFLTHFEQESRRNRI